MLDLAHDSFDFDDVAQARSPGSSGSAGAHRLRRRPLRALPGGRLVVHLTAARRPIAPMPMATSSNARRRKSDGTRTDPGGAVMLGMLFLFLGLASGSPRPRSGGAVRHRRVPMLVPACGDAGREGDGHGDLAIPRLLDPRRPAAVHLMGEICSARACPRHVPRPRPLGAAPAGGLMHVNVIGCGIFRRGLRLLRRHAATIGRCRCRR